MKLTGVSNHHHRNAIEEGLRTLQDEVSAAIEECIAAPDGRHMEYDFAMERVKAGRAGVAGARRIISEVQA